MREREREREGKKRGMEWGQGGSRRRGPFCIGR